MAHRRDETRRADLEEAREMTRRIRRFGKDFKSGCVARLRFTAGRQFCPNGLAVDRAGNVYVADTLNATIRKITPAGVVSTIAGLAGAFGIADGTNSAARFADLQGIAIDNAGNLYVSNAGDGLIRKFDPNGVVVNTNVGGVRSGSKSTTCQAGD
jgi:hypothetical protein